MTTYRTSWEIKDANTSLNRDSILYSNQPRIILKNQFCPGIQHFHPLLHGERLKPARLRLDRLLREVVRNSETGVGLIHLRVSLAGADLHQLLGLPARRLQELRR